MIKLFAKEPSGSLYPIEYNSFTFFGGEIQVRVGPKAPSFMRLQEEITIEADLFSATDFMELIHATDAARRRGAKKIKLICKYLPYARQDRVMNEGEALGLKVACDLINSLNFDSVEVWDVHSDTALALLNNVYHVKQSQLVRYVPVFTPDVMLVAPDAGAMKKVLDAAKGYGRDMITAEKKRDTKTGEITDTIVHASAITVGDRSVLVADDICDGGRTFVELAKALNEITFGKKYLYITHGIFSKGLDVFRGLFDKVYVANPFPGVDLNDPIISKLNIPKE